MIEKLLRYWKGIVRIRIAGNSPERFLNLCRNYHIDIWKLVYRDGAYEAEMLVHDLKKIKPIIHKSHTRLIIVKRMGMPFFFYRNRNRKITYISCFLFFFILYVMSLFIWNIQFEGNQKYTNETLMTFIHSKGYVQGMRINEVKCEELEKAIRAEYEDINWVSAMIDGTKLVVKIKENRGILHVEPKEERPGDLLADREGKIVSIVTRKGTPAVSAGMEVKKGDLLVSGTIDMIGDDGEVINSYQVEADADVILERSYHYEKENAYEYLARHYTKERKSFFLQFWKYRFELFPKKIEEQTEIITTRKQIHLFSNFYIPIYYGSCEKKYYEEWTQKYTKEELTEISNVDLQNYILNLEKLGVEIIKNSVKIEWNANGCLSAGDIIVHEKNGTAKSMDRK